MLVVFVKSDMYFLGLICKLRLGGRDKLSSGSRGHVVWREL